MDDLFSIAFLAFVQHALKIFCLFAVPLLSGGLILNLTASILQLNPQSIYFVGVLLDLVLP